MKVLITGGAGYIGSTTALALADLGHTPIILDNLVTGRPEFAKLHTFYHGDIGDRALLKRIFAEHPDIAATIHFGALIVVPDSVSNPYDYYTNNVSKSLELFKMLVDLKQTRVVFSSSASIYAVEKGFKVTENSPIAPFSPYSKTKAMMEEILSDFARAYGLRAIALRYFNPLGADPKLRTGLYLKKPTHAPGLLTELVLGRVKDFTVTGTHWPTRDGSGIRDYIHIWDLARAHVLAIEQFDKVFSAPAVRESANPAFVPINLGTGNGVTVYELIAAFEKAAGRKLPIKTAEPRPGDAAGAFANCDRAGELLGWEAQLSLNDAVRDAIRWGEVRDSKLSS